MGGFYQGARPRVLVNLLKGGERLTRKVLPGAVELEHELFIFLLPKDTFQIGTEGRLLSLACYSADVFRKN